MSWLVHFHEKSWGMGMKSNNPTRIFEKTKNKPHFKHSHPINIFEHTSKFLILLVFPVLRALFYSGWNLKQWLDGAWFDMLTIAVIVLLGLLAWFKYVYYLNDEGIYIKKGIFIIKKRFIPYRRLSLVSLIRPFYLMPFYAVQVRADTDGGNPRTPDFSITIKKSELDDFRNRATAPFLQGGQIKRIYKPKNFYIAVLSFVVSNSLAGVLLMATFISGMGKVLGEEVETLLVGKLAELSQKLAFGIPPIAAYAALVLLGGWGISFLINLIRHLRFEVTRKGGSLAINGGLITRREYLATVKRINLIELRQSFITKILKLYTTLIHCNGYGKGKDELSVLMPAGSRRDVMQNIKLLLPEIPICKPTVRPHIKYLSRFVIPPLSWTGITILLWIVSSTFLPQLYGILLFLFVMALIPCLWYFGVKIMSYFHTGVGELDGVYTFCYTYGYRIKTIAVPQRRIIKLTIRRSLFQVMSGCCDLVILTYSEGKKRHVVPNLEFSEAKKIMGCM